MHAGEAGGVGASEEIHRYGQESSMAMRAHAHHLFDVLPQWSSHERYVCFRFLFFFVPKSLVTCHFGLAKTTLSQHDTARGIKLVRFQELGVQVAGFKVEGLNLDYAKS